MSSSTTALTSLPGVSGLPESVDIVLMDEMQFSIRSAKANNIMLADIGRELMPWNGVALREDISEIK